MTSSYTSSVTTKTAISLPDDLFRQIERARKRAKKDRSTWIQEAASEYLKRKSKEHEIEDYFAAYERVPLTEDERAFDEWKARHWGELFVDETELRRRRKQEHS